MNFLQKNEIMSKMADKKLKQQIDKEFINLAEWLIKEHRSIFIDAEISLEDKKAILYILNISTNMLYN